MEERREVGGGGRRGEEEGEERKKKRREKEMRGKKVNRQSNMEVKTHLSIENVSFETSSLLSCTLLARSSFSSHK